MSYIRRLFLSVLLTLATGVISAQAETPPPLPPAMKHLANDATMKALWRHEATTVNTADMADAAMRILFALSYHVAGCHGPDAVVIPISITSTTTTKDGFGTIKSQETDTFEKVLKVRPEFAQLARKTVRYYSDNVNNRRFVAVRDLISQDRCDGPRLRHLEEGLAKAAGVSLPAVATVDTNLGADWRGFVMDCMSATVPDIINNELNGARICNVAEAALVELGNSDIYAVFRQKGLAAGKELSQADLDRFNAKFDLLYKDRDNPVHARGETFVSEAGLF
ncbi:hypothetical protein [Roseovarius rhodophyticola]|uniref:Uncharacterized protein n=1 Tax=Roseovarius rhodophyticola TaxID=3080827 RepID=A0ABZ2TKL2_9RHOB|nr:hypothetical protein [Roseovarius sp. W115]